VPLQTPATVNDAPIEVELSVRTFRQEMRDNEELTVGRNRKICPPLVMLCVIVVSVHEAAAPKVLGELFGVPLPLIVMPILAGMVMPEVHVQEPAGIWITSPSTAV
jgi:hypothetical protein